LFYGGAAGGGKTDLVLGLALTAHQNSLFLRRLAVDLKAAVRRLKAIAGPAGRWSGSGHGGTLRFRGRLIELAGCEHEDDRQKYQGQDHDLKLFDELSHFSRTQYRFIIGWNRSADPRQRCRVVAGGNPPLNPEGRWVVEEWAPWLDSQSPDPAAPGEQRWYTVIDEKTVWFRTGEEIVHKGERIRPRSRTFIPALLQDNPALSAGNYRSVIQGMPEPLRSQMLYGDFNAGCEDDAYQVIPTAWVQEAQARWRTGPPANVPLSAVGADIAHGGPGKTVLAKRYGVWFAPLEKHPGKKTPDGQSAGALILLALRENPRATAFIDADGVGASAFDFLNGKCRIFAVRSASKFPGTDRTELLTFLNLRAWAYWSFRDLLDPAAGHRAALPPDPELLADLTAPRWKSTTSGIKIEAKEDIINRLGRSPDCGDAVVYSTLMPAPEAPGPRRLVA
jgi:hypothetical protein